MENYNKNVENGTNFMHHYMYKVSFHTINLSRNIEEK